MPRVAIQGAPGSYSECAALSYFPDATIVPCERYDQLYEAVRTGAADHMVIPIENTTIGSIYNYYDLMLLYCSKHSFRIHAERSILIRLCLMGEPGATLAGIKSVKSHFAALGQCQRWLQRHGISAVEAYDTAGASLADRTQGKIASIQAAADLGVTPLEMNIQDLQDHNYTRFLLVDNKPAAANLTGPVKTSLAFCIPNEAGSLFRTLAALGSRKGLGIVRIESKNLIGTASHWAKFAVTDWDLIYYADIVAPAETTPSILAHLRELVLEKDGEAALQVFGTFAPGPLLDLTGTPWRKV